MSPLLLIGAGGHCRACIDVIESTNNFEIAGIVGCSLEINGHVMGYSVLGTDEVIPALLEKTPNAIITVGQIQSAAIRIKLFTLLRRHGAHMPVIQSSLAYCSKYSVIGDGTILMHGSLVNARSNVGENCIINSQALIEHDAEISDHCHISTGARVNGGVRIGRGSFIGSGSVLKEGVTLGDGVIIGAGQMIMRDVAGGTTISAKNV